MDWSKFAEEKINEAMASGELTPKMGLGQPINMDEYFAPRDQDRLAAHILRNSGHVPEEVTLMLEIAQLRAKLKVERDEAKRGELKKRLALVEVDRAMKLERRISRK